MRLSQLDSRSGLISTTLDTFSFVQKPYLCTIYIESKIEEDIDIETRFEIGSLFSAVDYEDIVTKFNVYG